METASITFITGGVRSGKSSFAERMAMEMAMKRNASLHYIATAKPTDLEMEKRINKHRKDREDSGFQWKTWEQETNIGSLAATFKNSDIILLDCITTLLSNELFAHVPDQAIQEIDMDKILKNVWNGILALQEKSNHLFLVSNEVLHEPILPNELVMTYVELLGKLHQQIVENAQTAYLVENGIPLLRKGESS